MAEKQKKDRYEMHKYWGKKPSNDLKTLIEKYSKEGDYILDPFSGYGVFCCEAYLLNRNVISNDLNPIANFINKQLLCEDLNLIKLENEWKVIKKDFLPFINKWYRYQINDKEIELLNILRDKNNTALKAKYRDTETKKTKEITFTNKEQIDFLKYESDYILEDWFPIESIMENSRISAKKGMKVSDLFTKRTLSCHARLFSLIENHSSGNEKELFKLAFTANLANCSKLVPPIKTRGDMAQGAWMTGFYIGPTYIENNVLHYFENRLKKVIKGKKDYLSALKNNLFVENNSKYQITQFDAKNLLINSESIDYVFTDPPYGDAVPYFEQSIIWNSWLRFKPKYENEIIISDSKTRDKKINNFELEMNEAITEIRRVLKEGAYFSLTYHSLSGNEWRIITNSCIRNGFELESFEWLVQKSFTPRQINREKSIKGDVLVTFFKTNSTKYIVLDNHDTEDFILKTVGEILKTNTIIDTNYIFLCLMENILKRKLVIGNVDILSILIKNFKYSETNKWTIL